jgi:hypothetical protein
LEPADVCLGAHTGLKSDVAPCPKSADFVVKVACWLGDYCD